MTLNEQKSAIEEKWERIKTFFLLSLPSIEAKDQAERYFSMIAKVEKIGEEFIFYTKNSYAAEFLQKEYGEKIKGCLIMLGEDENSKVIFKCEEIYQTGIIVPEEKIKEETHTEQREGNFQENDSSERNKNFRIKEKIRLVSVPLRKEYTFDEFVEGSSNGWAYSAAKGVASHPGAKDYNPLFIHGGTGLGKTHLMQAIGNEIKSHDSDLSICYIPAESFLNEYINSLQNKRMEEFKETFRNIDVLLIDDVQFLQKKNQFQEEFFNTFNSLIEKNKQVVMTSDVTPNKLAIMEERLISRFMCGMVQEIESPSYETRLAILQKKAESITPRIPMHVLKYIAENINSHVRAMEGALNKIKVILANNPRTELSQPLLSRLLKDFIENENSIRNLTVEEIQLAVAKKFNVSIKDINSSERSQTLVTPRQLAMYIARKYTNLCLNEIGDKFGKSHPTICHGVKQIQKRLSTESSLVQILEEILSDFGIKISEENNW